jgi:hypothetical protein
MEAIEETKRRERVSTAELYSALEALLPFARIVIECLDDYIVNFPDDADHVKDAARVRVGKEAIELAGRLIARKSGVIRRKQKALTGKHGQGDA